MVDGDPLNVLPSRREMLRRAGAGFGSLALAALLADDSTAGRAPADPLAPARAISRAAPNG